VVCVYTDREKEKGVVSTANYIARKYGVHSGMPIMQAKKLLAKKDAVFLPVDRQLYEEISLGIASTLAEYADALEQSSIDEFYLDISEKTGGDYEKAAGIANDIKNRILEKFKLTCSIGIAPNKLLAKMAAGYRKPDGLTIVKPEDVNDFLGPLEVDKIPGIGKVMKEYLRKKGITTIAQLRNADFGEIAKEVGKKTAEALAMYSRGEDNSPVMNAPGQKQISRITTLREYAETIEQIAGIVGKLSEEIALELKKQNLSCWVIGINAIDDKMRAYSKSRKFSFSIQDEKMIEKTALELYRELFLEHHVVLRRIGVRVEQLEKQEGQKTLFEF